MLGGDAEPARLAVRRRIFDRQARKALGSWFSWVAKNPLRAFQTQYYQSIMFIQPIDVLGLNWYTPRTVRQGPPPPPPINLKFFGFANKPGEPKRIFLSQGEDVFIAGEGDIVDRRYRILHISPVSVEVEDVLNNNRQTIPLTQG